MEKFEENNESKLDLVDRNIEKEENLAKGIEDYIKELHQKNVDLSCNISMIDISKNERFGYKENEKFYAASVYKLYPAVALYKKLSDMTAEEKEDFLNEEIEITKPNLRDADPEDGMDYSWNHKEGDKIKIKKALKYMLEYSNNTCANLIIDLVGKDYINREVIEKNNWSKLSRKFMTRNEDDIDEETEGTENNASEFSELLFMLSEGEINDKKLDSELLSFLRNSKTSDFNKLDFSETEYDIWRKDGWYKEEYEEEMDNAKGKEKEAIYNTVTAIIKSKDGKDNIQKNIILTISYIIDKDKESNVSESDISLKLSLMLKDLI